VASQLLIRDFRDGSPPDLEQRFADVGIPFFACFAIAILPVLPGLSSTPGPQWLFPIMGALAVSGMVVSNRSWHVAILGFMLAGYIVLLAVARSSLSA
jgi:hypothetical protein